MKIGEKQILAWLDGELDEAGAQEVEQAVQADADLMARAEAHFLAMMQLKAAFAPLLDAPFPNGPIETRRASPESADAVEPDVVEDTEEEVAEALAPAAVMASPPPSLQDRIVALGGRAAGRWGWLLAMLVLGVLIGRFVLGSSPSQVAGQSVVASATAGETVRDQDGSLIAAGALADALENGLAPGDAEPVHIPLSFRDKSGKLCRSFDTAQLAGIACRDNDGWRLRLALQTGRGGGSAASESPFIGQAVDAMIAGDPLDAGQQQAARDRGWR